MEIKDRILVALDVATLAKAEDLAGKLRGHVGGFKVGKQLCTAEGAPRVAKAIGRVFLDLKFHDIENTVAGAAKAAAGLGVKMFNVHCLGGMKMMEAARRALDEFKNGYGWRPLVLGVTILTSHDLETLEQIGMDTMKYSLRGHVSNLAGLAAEAGLDGVVCSPQEIDLVRSRVCDKGFLIVTPGIRRDSDPPDDQKRTMSASEALDRGADYLVIGRPITAQPDPAAAADAIVAEIEAPKIQ